MDANTQARIVEQGGKVASTLLRIAMARGKKRSSEPAESVEVEAETTIKEVPRQLQVSPPVSLPTREETTAELKHRLAKELYRAELDLASGLKIANRSCDCMEYKHTLGLEATAEELISSDPSNPVYGEIITWVQDNRPKVTVEAINSGKYASEYPKMASQFKDFRKRVVGTMSTPVTKGAANITLDDAKKIAAAAAAQEVERQWKKETHHADD